MSFTVCDWNWKNRLLIAFKVCVTFVVRKLYDTHSSWTQSLIPVFKKDWHWTISRASLILPFMLRSSSLSLSMRFPLKISCGLLSSSLCYMSVHYSVFSVIKKCWTLYTFCWQNCNEGDPPCPVILLERFGFEMKKGYRETQLQLLLSPAILLSSDKVTRPSKESHLTQGHLMLSGFQVYMY
jgi:hypothetical protein